jgi:hypothetical protein
MEDEDPEKTRDQTGKDLADRQREGRRDISEYPPKTDIDDYVKDCDFRIERMREDYIWLCAYTKNDSEPDHHFDIHTDGDGGLHITHRRD